MYLEKYQWGQGVGYLPPHPGPRISHVLDGVLGKQGMTNRAFSTGSFTFPPLRNNSSRLNVKAEESSDNRAFSLNSCGYVVAGKVISFRPIPHGDHLSDPVEKS